MGKIDSDNAFIVLNNRVRDRTVGIISYNSYSSNFKPAVITSTSLGLYLGSSLLTHLHQLPASTNTIPERSGARVFE